MPLLQRLLSHKLPHLDAHLLSKLSIYDQLRLSRLLWIHQSHLGRSRAEGHKPPELMHQVNHQLNAANSDTHYQPQMVNGPANPSTAVVAVAGGDPFLNVHQRIGFPLDLNVALQTVSFVSFLFILIRKPADIYNIWVETKVSSLQTFMVVSLL